MDTPQVIHIQAPNSYAEHVGRFPSVFLAGSIEMGKAEDWQTRVVTALEGQPTLGCLVLNPRRASWDASWEQTIRNPQFKEQVDWEMDALAGCDVIVMHFVPDTMSPITLLELGLHAASGKLLVSCPPGFWRRGNVEVVAERYHIPLFSSLEELLPHLYLKLIKT